MSINVAGQVAAIPAKSTQELKDMWRSLHGTEPPPYNRAFLVKRLAYRVQELAYGGVSPHTLTRLDALADEEEDRFQGKARKRVSDRPLAGTRLVREWQGVEHHVTVLADGFEYQGRKYLSLSAIARAITGTRWNGPLFFGLRTSGGSR
jgi:hypothetical protein